MCLKHDTIDVSANVLMGTCLRNYLNSMSFIILYTIYGIHKTRRQPSVSERTGRDQDFGREAILSTSRHNFKYVGLLITDSYFSTSVLKVVFFKLNIFPISDHKQ